MSLSEEKLGQLFTTLVSTMNQSLEVLLTDVVLAVLVEDVLELNVGAEVLHEVLVNGRGIDLAVVADLSLKKTQF